MFRDTRILVAGGTGFLGGAIARKLLENGAYVRASHFSRDPSFAHPRLEWLHADLREETGCNRAAQGMDVVIMAAANTSGAADIAGRPLIHVTPNVVMNARLIEGAYNARVRRYLFLSSAAAYPPLGDRLLAEDDMFGADPADVYFAVGWMKRYAELLCQTYATKLERPMDTVVVRPTNVYGPGDKFDWQRSHVTAALIRRVAERHQPIEVWGTGDDVRDLVYVDDFVEGVLAALGVADRHFTVNIGSGRTCSVKEILSTALAVDGYAGAEVRFDPKRPRTVSRLLVDVTRARERLGFVARTPLAEGIRRTLEWYRATFAKPH